MATSPNPFPAGDGDITSPHLRRLALGAYGTSTLNLPHWEFQAMPLEMDMGHFPLYRQAN